MMRVRVFGSMDDQAVKACLKAFDVVVSPALGDAQPTGFDFLLAGLGGDTARALMRRARTAGWALDNVYVDVALHGAAPWQAIGRRVWVDGAIRTDQLGEMLSEIERLPIVRLLHPELRVSSRVECLPRPDRP